MLKNVPTACGVIMAMCTFYTLSLSIIIIDFELLFSYDYYRIANKSSVFTVFTTTLLSDWYFERGGMTPD